MFASEDGGATWREFNLRAMCRVFGFDAKRPETVYAMTGGAGLFRSDDRGHTWKVIWPEPGTSPTLVYTEDEGDPILHSAHGYVGMGAFAPDPEISDACMA